MNIRKILSTVIICFIIESLYAINNNIFFSNITVKEGLSQITVLDIIQDSKGYMWFATRNGLNRYDGRNFVIYKNNPEDTLSLSNNHILCLAEDYKYNLWVGTINGLNKIDLKTNIVKRIIVPKFSGYKEKEIRSLLVDSENKLWIGSTNGLAIYDLTTDEFINDSLFTPISNDIIHYLYASKDNNIFICTQNSGLWLYNLKDNNLQNFSKLSNNIHLSNNWITTVFEDSNCNLWIGSRDSGITKIETKTGKIINLNKNNSNIISNNIRTIKEYNNQLFVGTFDGLYILDINTGDIIDHLDVSLTRGELNHYSIYSLYIDRAQDLWIGTYSGGVSYASKYNNRFLLHNPINTLQSFLGIYGKMEKDNDKLYIATEGGGVLIYNYKKCDNYSYYPINSNNPHKYSDNIIKEVLLENNKLLCGTTKGEIYEFDTKTHKYKLLYKLHLEVSIYTIIRCKDNSLWAVASDPIGLIRLNNDGTYSTEFTTKNNKKLDVYNARCIVELTPGVLLIGTKDNGIIRYDYINGNTKNFNTSNAGFKKFSNYITSIIKQDNNSVLISTFGGGIYLYNDKNGIVKSYTTDNGLLDNEIASMVKDMSGNLWISTTSGISKLDISNSYFTNYALDNGIAINEFSQHSGVLLSNGDICFGGDNGFITFNPEKIGLNDNPFSIVLNKLIVNNNEIHPNDKSGIINKVLDETEIVSLDYNQNNISIGYSALNYVFPAQNQYAVYMHGYDNDWKYTGNRDMAYYTNLKPGEYTFEVKGANNDGVWQNKTKKIKIIITPPIWNTWYAYIIYIFTVLTILLIIVYYIIKKQKLEKDLYYQRQIQLQHDEFHQKKIRMFTNFSHELRTPLTLIMGPLQELISINTLPSQIKNKINIIHTNAERLMLLVNQLLDFRKHEEGKLTLHISHSDLIVFMREIYLAFSHLAQTKSIKMDFSCTEESFYAYFDKTLIEKVVFNLLSNAIKFTPSNGYIHLRLKKIETPTYDTLLPESWNNNLPTGTIIALIEVTDSGCGIPENELENVFMPFYQANNQNGNFGTGIGLSLTKSIIDTHHGFIQVTNNESCGCSFKVYIPVNLSEYSSENIIIESSISEEVAPLKNGLTIEKNIERKWKILLVEDNDDVRQYVKDFLKNYFYIIDARNGMEALNIVRSEYPNLILSDIMMPVMDGLELCAKIKGDMEYEHIPVVLMTAKSMVEHIKEGFAYGADDYIIKPFNLEIMLSRLNNILESREKLKKLYGKKFSPEALGLELFSYDDRFTQRFFKVIEDNISNPELNIDFISKELGFSRSNMYRKLKAVTDISPIDLIRNKRLEIAAKLLLETSYSILEISERTGFNSQSYFTNCFKNVYGCSPSEWIRTKKAE